jgi:putative peptide modification system cyclase
LEQAFRIGLEQSRYVNVLSDLQVRDSLQRMQREPDLSVDRPIGAEIALREGSRALVLPTLAEVGGRLRFTAEVIDPTTQATVYSEYADGRGVESVLPLVDEVNRKLRERLGEAVAQVNESSKPLEKVATADLDALRSYSRAIELIDQGRNSEVVGLLERALEIDPGFARADLELGLIRYEAGDFASAVDHFKRSVANPERMSNREARLAASWLATLTSNQEDAIRQWRLLDLEYPEFFAASGSLAWNLWLYQNDHAEALKALERNVDEKNPRRAAGLYLQGSILTATEDFEGAASSFEKAKALGMAQANTFIARMHAATRNFEAAASALASGQSPTTDSARASLAILQSTLDLDVGADASGLARLAAAHASIELKSSWARRRLSLALAAFEATLTDPVSAPSYWPTPDLTSLEAIVDRVDAGGGAQAASELAETLQVIWIERLTGRVADASAYIDLVENGLTTGQNFRIDHWLGVLKAEDRLQNGASEQARAISDQLLGPNESVAARFVNARAQLTVGEHELALASARILYQRRGKAYTELLGSQSMLPLNVMMSNFGHCLATIAAGEDRARNVAETEHSLLQSAFSRTGSSLPVEKLVTKTCSRFPRALPAVAAQKPEPHVT